MLAPMRGVPTNRLVTSVHLRFLAASYPADFPNLVDEDISEMGFLDDGDTGPPGALEQSGAWICRRENGRRQDAPFSQPGNQFEACHAGEVLINDQAGILVREG